MVKAYYLRNEERDAEDRMAKDGFLPNWRELMDAGEDSHRGYVPGDKLVVVNDKPETFNSTKDENMTDIEIAETMFSMYNRKGYYDEAGTQKIDPNEREFAGPSMSVGDLVVMVGYWNGGTLQGDVTVLQVASCGWRVINPVLADAKVLFDVLPLPATAILHLELSRRA